MFAMSSDEIRVDFLIPPPLKKVIYTSFLHSPVIFCHEIIMLTWCISKELCFVMPYATDGSYESFSDSFLLISQFI